MFLRIRHKVHRGWFGINDGTFICDAVLCSGHSNIVTRLKNIRISAYERVLVRRILWLRPQSCSDSRIKSFSGMTFFVLPTARYVLPIVRDYCGSLWVVKLCGRLPLRHSLVANSTILICSHFYWNSGTVFRQHCYKYITLKLWTVIYLL